MRHSEFWTLVRFSAPAQCLNRVQTQNNRTNPIPASGFAPCETSLLDDSFSFDHCVEPVDHRRRDFRFHATRPVNLDFLYFGRQSKAKVQALIRAGRITSTAEYLSTLPNASGRDEYLCANGVVRAVFTSDEGERNPMVEVFHHVAKERRRVVHVVQHDVDATVIEQIAKGGPARGL